MLETMQLWREVMTRVGKDYPDVELTHVFVDAAAMMLDASAEAVRRDRDRQRVRRHPVRCRGNADGLDRDAAVGVAGDGQQGLYEPVHGSAPDIAGKNIANPLAAILSARNDVALPRLDDARNADRISAAVKKVLAAGYRTGDIFQPGMKRVGT